MPSPQAGTLPFSRPPPPILSFFHSFFLSFVYSFTYSSIHSFTHSLIHYFESDRQTAFLHSCFFFFLGEGGIISIRFDSIRFYHIRFYHIRTIWMSEFGIRISEDESIGDSQEVSHIHISHSPYACTCPCPCPWPWPWPWPFAWAWL